MYLNLTKLIKLFIITAGEEMIFIYTYDQDDNLS